MKTTTEKILISIVVLLIIYAAVTTFEKLKFESKYNSEVEKGITVINDSIDALNLQLKDLTLKQQNWTENVQKQSNDIHNKLKSDEETIDNSVVTDNELADFIAKHENR